MTTTLAPLTRARETAASLAVSAIAFLVVTGETLPVGLIRDVAGGLDATVGHVGLSVSLYALVAAASGVPMTRLAARFDRRAVLVVCAVVFGVTQLVAAAAPGLAVFLVARAVAALTHGVYFAVATPAVVRLARPEVQGRAGSRVAVGGSLALVLGTPLGTLVGQSAGWRVAMAGVGLLALALAVVVARLLPPMPPAAGAASAARGGVVATLRPRALRVVMVVTAVLVTAHFSLFTYIALFADDGLGVTGRAFSVLLLVYGTAAVLGSTWAGRLADRHPVRGLRAGALVLTAALVVVWLAGRLHATAVGVPALVVWGGAFSLLVVSTALAVLRRAGAAQAETAFAVHGIVFQVGIVSGSALGAALHGADLLGTVPLVAAGGGAVVLALAVRGGRAFRSGPVG
ncbi:MFS transporter [Cellulomonas endophytica]|uniref:MFS transporter n=1 Tax=Cellulomonas endophytica TaxID=2494735 RepID=UPI001F0CA6E7|nr:MFS transporter [Cellulomonas endophytica]